MDTGGEPPVKSIQLEGNGADFSGFVFPGDAFFERATFSGYARFESATFSGGARFESATFSGHASFASATFSGDATFESATFSGHARFASATFSGDATFERATFSGGATFERATFSGYARFASATFSGYARFASATFSGHASFESATFSGHASFASATFSGDATFERATFSGNASFERATFSGYATFERATFSGYARFTSATFSGNARFESATFSGNARFESATFSGHASFASATFSGNASFESATFSGYASFESATFKKDAFFQEARFSSPATFALCDFLRHATFEASRFAADASFGAIRGERGFNMAGAVFEVVPDFIQAHFEEAPRLDNLEVGFKPPQLKKTGEEDRAKPGRRGRWHRARLEKSPRYRRMFEAVSKDSDLRNIPARFRALKRLAIQGNDTERELEFHARELRSQRFVEDWPAPWRGKGAHVWKSVLGFWSGLAYGLFSNYGRSLLRPALFWLAGVALGAVCYVSQSPGMIEARAEARAGGSYAAVATLRTACGGLAREDGVLLWGRCGAAQGRGRQSAALRRRAIAKPAKRHGHRQRGVAPGLPQRLHRARRIERGRAPHLWLPLRRGAVWRLEPARHRAVRRVDRQRRAEALLRADDLPVRPGAQEHAEDEVMGGAGYARVQPLALSLSSRVRLRMRPRRGASPPWSV